MNRLLVLRPVHDARRAAERRGAAQFGAVPRISRTCGGAPPPAAMPRRADRIQFYLCAAALGGGSYARASHVDSTNRKILKNTTKSCVGFYSGIPSRSACAS